MLLNRLLFGHSCSINKYGISVGKPIALLAHGIETSTNEPITISLKHPAIMGAVFDYGEGKWVLASSSVESASNNPKIDWR